MRSLLWTDRARDDLAEIHSFIARDSSRFADVVVESLLDATERLVEFPRFGREVPEFSGSQLRELVHRPYRIVYRVVGEAEVHVPAVHHGSRRLPDTL